MEREKEKAKGRTRTRLDLRTKQLDSAGWMILGKNFRMLNLLVMSTAGHGFEMPRADRAAHVFFVHSSKNVISECPEVPCSWGKVFSGVQGG